MDLDDNSTSSYDYASYSSLDECEVRSATTDTEGEETYEQHGTYDEDIADQEDPKLQNWKRWINVRKKQHNVIKTAINRDAANLIMNTDDVYEKAQNARLINYATNYVEFDKYRGDPKFWNTPHYIYDDGAKSEAPVNCPVQEKYNRMLHDKNEPPTMEYVGLPRLTRRDKGIMKTDTKETIIQAQNSQYYRDKKKKLKHNLGLIEKFPPDIDNLYVCGEPLPIINPTESQTIEDILVDTTLIVEEARRESTKMHCNVDERYPILKIQGEIVNQQVLSSLEEDFKQVIEFQNCFPHQLYPEKLVIENVGNICVRYSWEEVKRYCNPIMPVRYSMQHVKRFFFPTVSNVCPPGQVIEIPFWFRSREPGVYHETWKLVTEPKLSKDKAITFTLQGFVRAEIETEKIQEIVSYIHQCRVTSASIDLFETVVSESRLEKPIPYDNLFLKKDVFLHNNPNHFYVVEKVQALIELFEKIPLRTEWDLSIITLRNKILNYAPTLEDKRKYLVELFEISNSLLKPTIDLDIDNEKHRCVYQILCTFCNTLELDSHHLRTAFGVVDIPEIVYQPSLETIQEQPTGSISKASSKSSNRKSRSNSNMSFSKNVRHSALPHTASLQSQSTTLTESESSNLSTQSSSVDSKLDLVLMNKQRKSMYVKTLCIKTYQRLLTTVDEITAVIESLNIFIKPR